MRIPKVLLVYPPNQLMDVEVPRPDGSLGLLYLAGALRKVGVEVDILDASVGGPEDLLNSTFYRRVLQSNGLVRIGMSVERIGEFISRGGYDIVGVNSNFTPQTKMALEVARAAKEVGNDILVMAGGVNARNLPEKFFKSGMVDLICSTEGEGVIVKAVQNWSKGISLRGIPGTIFSDNGNITHIPLVPDPVLTNLDNLPFPAWDLLPFEKYEKISAPHGDPSVQKDARYAPVMTSRGCPFECVFCHISKEKEGSSGNIGSLRLKSTDRVLEEIRILQSLGVKRLFFEDDSLLAKKSRVRLIFEKVASMGLSIANVNGVNLVHFLVKSGRNSYRIDKDYLIMLKEAGFDCIVFPVESASQRVLDKYATGKLNHQNIDVLELVGMANEVGIASPINIMMGFPDETEAEIMSSIELGKKLVVAGARYVTYFIPIPFPGSRLFDIAMREGHLEPDFDPDIMNWKRPVMKKTVVSPERLIELRDWAWHETNRPDYIEQRLRSNIGSRTDSFSAGQ